MSREQKYTAIILKKQPFKEGDEIITLFTEEQGKLRALAKSVKLSKSKLQQKLQSLFLVEIIVSHGQLPKIIGVEPVEVFPTLRENLTAMKMAFYCVELVLKFTADEHKNQQLFDLLADFLRFLNATSDEKTLGLGLTKFKLEILSASGFSITKLKAAVGQGINSDTFRKSPQAGGGIYFSRFKGGFSQEKTGDAVAVVLPAYEAFLKLRAATFSGLPGLLAIAPTNIGELQRLFSGFIEYHLERRVKSEQYLQNGDVV